MINRGREFEKGAWLVSRRLSLASEKETQELFSCAIDSTDARVSWREMRAEPGWCSLSGTTGGRCDNTGGDSNPIRPPPTLLSLFHTAITKCTSSYYVLLCHIQMNSPSITPHPPPPQHQPSGESGRLLSWFGLLSDGLKGNRQRLISCRPPDLSGVVLVQFCFSSFCWIFPKYRLGVIKRTKYPDKTSSWTPVSQKESWNNILQIKLKHACCFWNINDIG